MFSLLIESTNPKFVLISAGAGSITHAAKFNTGFAAYGSSKAAANYLVEKIQGEHDNLGRLFHYLKDVIYCFFLGGGGQSASPYTPVSWALTCVSRLSFVEKRIGLIDDHSHAMDGS